MRSLIVYESMYGNTRQVAEAIAEGCRQAGEATAVRACDCDPQALAGVDLVVLGGPTHAWSMSRPKTRTAAITNVSPGTPPVEAQRDESGIRELLGRLPRLDGLAAAYDTRIAAPAALPGRASAVIARRLRRAGTRMVAEPRSFLVSRGSRLQPGQLEQARAWGTELTELHARASRAGKHR